MTFEQADTVAKALYLLDALAFGYIMGKIISHLINGRR